MSTATDQPTSQHRQRDAGPAPRPVLLPLLRYLLTALLLDIAAILLLMGSTRGVGFLAGAGLLMAIGAVVGGCWLSVRLAAALNDEGGAGNLLLFVLVAQAVVVFLLAMATLLP